MSLTKVVAFLLPQDYLINITNFPIKITEMHELLKGPLAPVAQWVKRWPTDLADQVRYSPEVKSSQP